MKGALVFAMLAWLLGVSFTAQAQFVGDVFFLTPSVAVAKGNVGDLDLALFAGDRPFGAARISVQFDPQRLEIVNVVPVQVGAVLPVLEWSSDSGVLKLVVVNGQSLAVPIGSVTLARISVRAIGEAGDQIEVSSAVTEAYAADRVAFPVGSGYSAEVSIGSVTSGSVAQRMSKSAPLQGRALKMRPAGHAVTLLSRTGKAFYEVDVLTIDPSAPRE
jgi:hypothetical protein